MFRLFTIREELKKKITRSFSRKIQIKEYEPIEAFASYSEEFPSDTTPDVLKRASQFLYDQAEAVLNCKKEIAAERVGKQTKEIKSDSDLDL